MDKAAVLDVAVTGYFEHRFEVDHRLGYRLRSASCNGSAAADIEWLLRWQRLQ